MRPLAEAVQSREQQHADGEEQPTGVQKSAVSAEKRECVARAFSTCVSGAHVRRLEAELAEKGGEQQRRSGDEQRAHHQPERQPVVLVEVEEAAMREQHEAPELRERELHVVADERRVHSRQEALSEYRVQRAELLEEHAVSRRAPQPPFRLS